MRSTVLSTRTKPARKRNLQEGQAIILIALLILVLFGMLGLAIDSGRGYVDRRDQQAAVDASALAAGDWFENYTDLTLSINQSVALYQRNLRIYTGIQTSSHTHAFVGPTGALDQDTYDYTFGGGYSLTIVATDTQFNGYQFVYTTNHSLPLAFMQIFGGSKTIPISATATSIVGNQRQTPALLTLSTDKCSMNLTGSAQLTVLGDVYSNGQACLDSNLHEAGNCYGAAGSNCSDAQYYCYNSDPGYVPHSPPCDPNAGEIAGTAIVPAPTLPDPGFLATSVPYYPNAEAYGQYNRGTWTEMRPGQYNNFHLSGGSASCAFLDAGVYNWLNDYSSDANGSFVSNELRAPDEQLYSAPGTASVANPQFWDQNGVTCSGHFTVTNAAVGQTILLAPACTDLSPLTPAGCHSGGPDTKSRNNRWGAKVTPGPSRPSRRRPAPASTTSTTRSSPTRRSRATPRPEPSTALPPTTSSRRSVSATALRPPTCCRRRTLPCRSSTRPTPRVTWPMKTTASPHRSQATSTHPALALPSRPAACSSTSPMARASTRTRRGRRTSSAACSTTGSSSTLRPPTRAPRT